MHEQQQLVEGVLHPASPGGVGVVGGRPVQRGRLTSGHAQRRQHQAQGESVGGMVVGVGGRPMQGGQLTSAQTEQHKGEGQHGPSLDAC